MYWTIVKSISGFIIPTITAAKINITIEYNGALPKNSPRKISFGLTGVANNDSLNPTSISRYTLFKGYITKTKKNIIKKVSMSIATTGLKMVDYSAAKVGINKSNMKGAITNAHKNKNVYIRIKTDFR